MYDPLEAEAKNAGFCIMVKVPDGHDLRLWGFSQQIWIKEAHDTTGMDIEDFAIREFASSKTFEPKRDERIKVTLRGNQLIGIFHEEVLGWCLVRVQKYR